MTEKKEAFNFIQQGKINSKNYEKNGLSKSKFYKIYKRVRFYQKLIRPLKLMVLNLSEREFQAVLEGKEKEVFFKKSKSKSFPHTIENSFDDGDEMSD